MKDITQDTGKSNFLEMIPTSVLSIIIDKNTSLLQKKTAFKVLQTYYRNFTTEDFNSMVNFDEIMLKKIKEKIKIYEEKDKQNADTKFEQEMRIQSNK